MREVDLAVLRERRPGCNIRCQQRYSSWPTNFSGEIRQGWHPCRHVRSDAVHLIWSVEHRILNSYAESLCDNKEIIQTNIRSVKISSPDVCITASQSHSKSYLVANSIVVGIQTRLSKIIIAESKIVRNITSPWRKQHGLSYVYST